MDDRLLLSVFIYMTIATLVIGFLPSGMFSGSRPSNFDELGNDDPTNTVKQISFFGKLVRFIFAPFVISGIPLIISSILTAINYFCIIIAGIWLYDKIRGIS